MTSLRLSPSRISEFENCPQKYKYRVIDQLPEPPSLDAERGTLVHTILENLFELPSTQRTLENALAMLPEAWGAQILAKPELRELVPADQEWLDRAASLISTYFNLENPQLFEPTHREMHLEHDLSEDLYLHGYVDRLDIAPTGEVRIVDYKTGKAPKPGWEGKALFQLQVYALLYWKNHGVLPRLLQLIYMGNEQLIKSSPTIQDLEKTEAKLLDIAYNILEAIENDSWRPKPSKLCDWCSFKNRCPAFS